MHHTLALPSPWPHHSSVDVSGFVPPHDGRPDEMKGRAALNLSTSCVQLQLRPTAAELRELANLCRFLADDMETSNVPAYGPPRASWPAGCTHLPGVPA